jgi:hypothetical protein
VNFVTTPDYRKLPERIDPDDTIEEIDVTPPHPDEGLPQPDKNWFASGG